ncbi:hypothetical protein K466DRAFT_606365 [Polyporus arcularius HHB13444]|uniref:Uncharacterized protein n=1 Tax=Polyporus arcularius HHB13444 TaxID=1314778 RepID=A0A5C3NNC8_9APHY|nr:hypothetical protein K466DRAFT_606365 [Polyporus arcularius HHB13444]
METNPEGRILVRATPPTQQPYEEEVPVATDDELTAKGTPEGANARQDERGPLREQSDSLPSSSPISVCFTDDDEVIGVQHRGGSFSPMSFDSIPFWGAETPTSRTHPGPGAVLFDDHESASYEEGEIDDLEDEDLGPPPNQEMSRTESSLFGTREEEACDNVLGEHSETRSTPDLVPTASKRHWTGSPASEELNRSRRRLKREASDDHENTIKLPPIHEMTNPWGGTGSAGFNSFRFQHPPVAVSTPRRSVSTYHTTSTPSNYRNMSGQPPTPFSLGSSVADEEHPPPRGRSTLRRDDSRASRSGAGRPPVPGSRRFSGTSSLLEAVDRRDREERNINDVLADPESTRTLPRNPPREPAQQRWPGGYAPGNWASQREEGGQRRRRPAVEDMERSDDRFPSVEHESYFSAIPNTKAWAYKTQNRSMARSQSRDEDERMSGLQESQRDEYAHDEYSASRRARNRSRSRSTAFPREQSYAQSMFSHEEELGGNARGGRGEEDYGALDDWNMAAEGYGAVPTAMAEDAEADDTPVLLAVPSDRKWATFFDDPETLIRGQSSLWTRVIWGSASPIVLFTVFNYKYTRDGAINKHIQLSVTALTKYLTGEQKFYVVPPDPDTTLALKGRDLPFVWVIRGLTESGAKTMTSLRAISTRAVSIITYPRAIGNPRWVCGLVNFLTRDVESIREAVLQVLREESMLRLLEDLTRNSRQLANIPQHRRVEYVINSLRIRITEAEDEDFVANVYLFPPTDDTRRWREWADRMRRCSYNVFLNGTGSARKIFWCAGCRGVDHEAGECRFPLMEGWKGPEAGERSHTREQIASGKKGGSRGQGGSVAGQGSSANAYNSGQGRGAERGRDYEHDNGWSRGRGGGHRSQGTRSGWQGRMPPQQWTPRPYGRGGGGGNASRWN